MPSNYHAEWQMAEIRLGKPKVVSEKRKGIRDAVKALSPEQRQKMIKILQDRKRIREMKRYKQMMGKKGGFA